MDEKFLEIKKKYYEAGEIEGEEYKWMALRNEDMEYLFSLIEQKE
jgi:hypothetical protein